MEIYEIVDLTDCPLCFGSGVLEEDEGGFYVICRECGCRTVYVEPDSDSGEDRLSAAQRAAMLWNMGKVISSHPGE